MEKVICALWKPSRTLLTELPEALIKGGARDIRINLQDDAVALGHSLRQIWQEPQHDAVVQYWVPSANPSFHEDVLKIVAGQSARLAAWLVAESTIIANSKHPPTLGERTEGWAQMAFLTLPNRLTWAEWRMIWRDDHTKVAIETQANFEYIQNLVLEPLTEDAPPYIAIVEECFPRAALTDPFAFFDAVGDQEKFDRNLAKMMESCIRFIEFGTIDVIPTSQFNFA